MNINDTIEYHIGYIDEHEFWSTDVAKTFENAKEIIESRKSEQKHKVWMIFEKLTIFRKAIPQDISVPY